MQLYQFSRCKVSISFYRLRLPFSLEYQAVFLGGDSTLELCIHTYALSSFSRAGADVRLPIHSDGRKSLRRTIMRRSYTLLYLLAIVLAGVSFAQVNAVVSGTVSDSSGAPMPKVEVVAKNVSTGIATTSITNETGSYVFPSLQPGTYTITASAQGFRTTSLNNVELSQNAQVRQNFTMEVSAGAQSIEVTAEADTSLTTTSATVGNTLTSSQLLALPVQSRNVLDFVTTTAGVVKIPGVFGDIP